VLMLHSLFIPPFLLYPLIFFTFSVLFHHNGNRVGSTTSYSVN
jgi:hypothetical protein